MRNVIVGAIGSDNHVYDKYILEWIISLRYLAKYENEVLLLNYGISNKLTLKLKQFNVNLVSCVNRGFKFIPHLKMVDLIPILEKQYKYCNIVYYDIDIWFQDCIYDIFNQINKTDGMIFSIKPMNPIHTTPKRKYLGSRRQMEVRIQYGLLRKKFGGFINGGFFAGKYNAVINKLYQIKTLFETLYEYPTKDTDQFFLNMKFDFEKDKASVTPFNCASIPDQYTNGNTVYTNINNKKTKAIGVHCHAGSQYYSVDPGENKHPICFADLYPDLFNLYSK